MAEQTIQLLDSWYSAGSGVKRWNPPSSDNPAIDNALAQAGTERTLANIFYNSNTNIFGMDIASPDVLGNPFDLSDAFENSGSITLTAGGNSITLRPNDTSDPYHDWHDQTEVAAFFASLSTVDSSESGTLVIRDFVPSAPTFTDETGDAITGTVGQAIASVTVPEATGGPAPTYAQIGTVAGVSFDTATRVISFDEDAIVAGSGTITIRATNTEGTADWTVDYAFAGGDAEAPTVTITAPTAIDERDDANLAASVSGGAYDTISWTWEIVTGGGTILGTGSTVSYIAPSVAADGQVEVRWTADVAGTGTNAVDGTTDSATGTFTLTVRNVPAAPVFDPDRQDPVTWTVGRDIGPFLIPAVDEGDPAPAYTAAGLPAGLAFDSASRNISGTPSAAGTGTVTITATNSEGSGAYSFAFTVQASLLPGQRTTRPRTFRRVIASFVADAAIALVRAAADEIGGPAATTLRANAATLVYNVGRLGIDMDAAIGAITEIDKMEELAFNALATYPAVVGMTQNRNQERLNQAALIDFVRALATVRFAERVGIEAYRDREQARDNRDRSTEALDAREDAASTNLFRALRSLRAAVVEHVRGELLRLPPVIIATPASVQPSLAVAYDIYEDVGRADDIVGRAVLPRPGFVPANPIALPGE